MILFSEKVNNLALSKLYGRMDNVLSQFNAGDERAFQVLFYRFFKHASLFVKRFISDHDAIEDVVQETFIGIWEHRGACEDMLSFRAYLYKALRNNALYYLRKHHKEDEIDPALIDENGDFFAAIISGEVHREILNCVGKLSTERKKIIELTLQGHSQDEIATLLKISVNTVKTQKRHAYAFLRSELKNLFILFLLFYSFYL